MNATVVMYATYVGISVAMTIWVARTLHKNGRRFLVDVFSGDGDLADSVNHLLVVGFYLINFGFISLALKTSTAIGTTQVGVEVLSSKVGFVLLVLGAMHFFNLAVFARVRRRAVDRDGPATFGASGVSSSAAITAGLARDLVSEGA